MAFLEWLQFSWLGTFVAENLWAYPTFETLHVMGMALLIGVLGLTNLRVLGYKPELPLVGMRELLPLAWGGFTVNMITGLALFSSDAVYFFSSWTFRIKILLIILAGINAAVLSRGIFREVATGADVTLPPSAKWIAASSLVFWLAAVMAGRLVAYLP
ncbi:MAG: hypothetical protein V3R81_09855 [Gammaproteobacteria bacterium]